MGAHHDEPTATRQDICILRLGWKGSYRRPFDCKAGAQPTALRRAICATLSKDDMTYSFSISALVSKPLPDALVRAHRLRRAHARTCPRTHVWGIPRCEVVSAQRVLPGALVRCHTARRHEAIMPISERVSRASARTRYVCVWVCMHACVRVLESEKKK